MLKSSHGKRVRFTEIVSLLGQMSLYMSTTTNLEIKRKLHCLSNRPHFKWAKRTNNATKINPTTKMLFKITAAQMTPSRFRCHQHQIGLGLWTNACSADDRWRGRSCLFLTPDRRFSHKPLAITAWLRSHSTPVHSSSLMCCRDCTCQTSYPAFLHQLQELQLPCTSATRGTWISLCCLESVLSRHDQVPRRKKSNVALGPCLAPRLASVQVP